MANKSKYIKWFNEVGKEDVSLVGGKGANLGEMIQNDFPVPNGYVVTAATYFDFIEETGLKQKLKDALAGLDVNDSKALAKAASNARKLIMSASPSPEIQNAIVSAYQQLANGKNALVAVRSSATAEDLPDASFAGQQESYMNIKGKDNVLKTIQTAWSSLFEDRAVFYRVQKGFDHFKVGIAVPVQLMVQSEASGVMFTVDPISNDANVISIEGGFGFGDAVVSGSITPDQYIVDKQKMEITSKQIVDQNKMLAKSDVAPENARPFREESELFWVDVPKPHQNSQKITDEQILRLAEIGKKLEDHYNHPQDIEWAIEKGEVYMVQTRPITTIPMAADTAKAGAEQAANEEDTAPQDLPDPILEGLGASPGVATGPVRIIKDSTEIDKVNKGDVLVTEMTTPDYVPAMRRAVAVVTNLGGRTSHAAIVSRELGIPAVVGTELATETLKLDEVITVDGRNGKVYAGEIKIEDKKPNFVTESMTTIGDGKLPEKTATKVYCNLGEPQLAEDIAKRDVDGIGLLRAEFMIANIGEHPRYMLEKGRREKFIDELHEGLMKFAKAFDPRPVVYRATDFRTNEYRGLHGGEKYEDEEENPMIGFRGVSRYIADPEVFQMELEAIKQVRRYHQNLWLMVPFVRTPQELKEVKKIMAGMNLYQSGTFKLFIMVEVPSTVIMLEQFIGVGIDGVSIGSNDLTQLILGVDRDNGKIANIFDERNPAVMWALEKTIRTCQEHGIMASICGQAPSEYPELVEKLVEWGVTSISVSPDVIEQTRQIVKKAEYDKLRGLLI
ncbi:phosphoenolpyruvate synthase [candidate division WWE3 bacterium]|uniref:Phosphoenolpyruvate synthase n=1 Tax=candidate division WWE3 bacterium TaxID=2053526 RepID=A0A955RS24_UNCKA|nr:phosphoenolpyruvate synthase [candidate division WWE3 bacterium]